MGKSALIGWYLVKNYILNPFLRKFRRFLKLIAAGTALVALVIVLLALLYTPLPQAEEAGGLHEDMRAWLVRLGLGREEVVNLGSSGLFALTLAFMFIGRAAIYVWEEAEREVLLAQPVSMREYIAGRVIYETAAATLLILLPFLCFIPLVLDFNGGSLAKALVFVVVSAAAMLFIVLASMVGQLLRCATRPKHLLAVRAAAGLYLLLSATHSILALILAPAVAAP